MIKTVGVKFVDGYFEFDYDRKKVYRYLTDIEDIKSGDVCIVESPHNGYTFVMVVEVSNTPTNVATKWIIQKLDLEAHKRRVEIAQKRREIEKQLKEEAAKHHELTQYRMIAQMNPKVAALLDELEKVGGL